MSDDDAAPTGKLRQVYGLERPAEVIGYYDEWADSYDAELTDNGYATPKRVAEAIAGLAPDLAAAVLDYGCGTGMSGRALQAAGFAAIDGADPSTEMLRVAESSGVYRTLIALDIEAPAPPFEPGSYDVVTAIGVIGPGAAPLALFDQLLDLVSPNGLFGLSLNDLALEDSAYQAALRDATESGRAEQLVGERGPHLPGIDVQSTVYVFRRMP